MVHVAGRGGQSLKLIKTVLAPAYKLFCTVLTIVGHHDYDPILGFPGSLYSKTSNIPLPCSQGQKNPRTCYLPSEYLSKRQKKSLS